MIKKFRKPAALLFMIMLMIAVGVYGCVAAPDAGTGIRVSGRELYERSCQSCHALFKPGSHSDNEWGFTVKKYGRAARLSRQEQEKVRQFLINNN